ncbi:MAG: arylsulfatase [Saprospiraceae bacterium]|nr:arylsulfatase [Saprospiraceae bacterium]
MRIIQLKCLRRFHFKAHILLWIGFMGFVLASCGTENKKPTSPNIIYFLADDLGYGETGIYGQKKIKTPHIDALAKTGMRFTQHYSGAPVCAPARCIFLTGKHSGHAAIRGNDEWAERGDVWDYEKAHENANLEGQRPMPDGTMTIGHKLQEAGYKTSIFGKWGLGAPLSESVPTKKGFDYFFGYNCQRQAHNLYPSHLWENDEKVFLKNDLIAPRTKLAPGSNPENEESYTKFTQQEYAPEVIHKKAISFIKENSDNPFFMYYASPLPHLPLQVPSSELKAYQEEFGDEKPYLGNKGYFPNKYPKATYAAMITYLDKQLGELIATLKEEGIYENTIIFFTSDNGPTYTGGVDYVFFGSSKPFANGYGRTKGFLHEGGIRVPLIASWPNKIGANTISQHVSGFQDMMPTMCEIAGIASPENTDGISLLPELKGKKQAVHDYLYWEFPSYKGQQAVLWKTWKGVRKNIFDGNMDIELYNIEVDYREENDLSESYPKIVQFIADIMEREHTPSENEKFKFKELGDI